jgi:acyl-CoA oxidase
MKSPHITSAKYWPGNLGMVSTHNVIQARTFVKGKSIGIQTFVFETRNENLKPVNGVKAGDIGPKFGFHRVDNGYLSIDNVEVPRDSMLMKFVQVTPEGEVLGRDSKGAIKYAYGSMLALRVTLSFRLAFGHIIEPSRNLSLLYQQMGVINQP